ncbi:NAD(P)/FAD-dependent oxidoreductase [Clostridium thailandense]|uniref:NAD(P)/FAD-dependent oxidoreductase n=1 Tax=Clostridium thailandense TaxID=2794346 RepID=A0A949TZH7_9CLOT|nr:NAD(P)/FAD-dependent oxidoreductase [Clostridium thailandense]MBV7273434.1 NAD(P)/FAD-dependent oxidoreductase [Clostridium thailandense]
MKTDILIIGGGVIGAAIAHRLSKYNLDITLVEKESDICMGASKANSSMVHDGYNVDAHKLKGKLVLEANPYFEQLCSDLHVQYVKDAGSIVVGFNDDDLKVMKEQLENGNKNGIKGLKIVGKDELLELEPYLNPEAKFGLLNPNTGLINPFELTMAMAENAVINGAKVLLNTEVKNIIISDKKVEAVETSQGVVEAKVVINAAGLYADKIAAMVEDIDFEIKPRKGQYFLYDKKWGYLVKHVIYSAPSKVSKGMIILPTTEGNILGGSNATVIDDKDDLSTTYEGFQEIYVNTISHMFPDLPRMGDVVTTFSGLRAASTSEDFIIECAKTVKGFINVAGIQSPGLSSSPAIARMVEDLVRGLNYDLNFTERKNYRKDRPEPVILKDLSYEERSELIKKNPDYGTIICRCETVSKGEIIDAIHRPIPATNLDAVKRRSRAGMGRCQGGFCSPRVLDILSKELKVSPLNITKKGKGSYILITKTKEPTLKMGGEGCEKIKL